MWLYLEDDEFEIIDGALANANLHGLRALINPNQTKVCPYNPKLTKESAIESAKTYFGSDDVIIENDYVKWDKSCNAMVMVWQKVPSEYIPEGEYDCGCGK